MHMDFLSWGLIILYMNFVIIIGFNYDINMDFVIIGFNSVHVFQVSIR